MAGEIPSKQDMNFVFEMLEAGLIDCSYTQPWAQELIATTDTPPSWLRDLATKSSHADQVNAVWEYLSSEPIYHYPDDDKFHVACLWLRHERRELSWATFLLKAGEYLDRISGDWWCEVPYHYLNVYEDAYFTEASEESTKREYLAEHDLIPWIELARRKFEPFFRVRRKDKHRDSRG